MSTLTSLGLIAVSAMLAAYALEERSRGFVLLFAAACAGSSAYGFAAGTWPFGLVEAVWAVVAYRRWTGRRRAEVGGETSRPIVCDMTALSSTERQRYDAHRSRVLDALSAIEELPSGFRIRIAGAIPVADLADWIDMERRCCSFLDIDLSLKADGSRWIQMSGSTAIKTFLEQEFDAFRGAPRR